MHQRTYQFGVSKLTLCFGDITGADTQVIVSSDDCYISMGGGVSAAILRAGGEAIALDASKKVPAALGDIVVTSAGALKAQYVFHAITIGAGVAANSPAEIVEKTTRRCIRLLDGLQLSSIAFPAIGAGVAGFPYSEVAATMARTIEQELQSSVTPVNATIYLFDRFGNMNEMDFIGFFEEFSRRAPGVAAHLQRGGPTIEAKPSCIDLAVETQEDHKRQRLHNLRRLLSTLEEKRGQLEHQIVAALDGDTNSLARAHEALQRNQDVRLRYLTELQSFTEPGGVKAPQATAKAQPKTVFVSSTYSDLSDARGAVRDALARSDLFFRGMEHFGAFSDALLPASKIVEEVRNADIYLGVFGMRYGSVDNATGLSMTELEFREAEAQKKPMLLYVIDKDAPVTVANVETNAESYGKLAALKSHILSTHVAYLFKSVDDLARQVYADLQRLKT